jgi:elongation factor G
LVAKSKGDEDKIFSSLTRLLEEDPGIKLDRNAETKEILLSGLGQVHIEATIEKLKRKFNVEAILNTPKIPYRETIKKKVRVQGKHKKQTGGHGQFGDCWIQMEPLPRGEGFEFVDAIVGGVIPKTYIPAVEKGIVESCPKACWPGFPASTSRSPWTTGPSTPWTPRKWPSRSPGPWPSKRRPNRRPKPVLLEPIMSVTVTTPDEFMGDIMGDLNGRRGRVLGMDSAGKTRSSRPRYPWRSS